ncbi:hypothetical protein QBC43DRAFT_351519 [Cladorrhinum sp. PSN259]|nr:hypothetical protein QBC43DRAFT_351519 [Cladorrhinum sp. PSN259]
MAVEHRGKNGTRAVEVVIAVMGVTGAGASTFIKQISGQDVVIGKRLESCVNLTLLETPGFIDTNRSATTILGDISAFRSSVYARGIRLLAIIYLNPICNPRMEGTSLRSLGMLRKLVGDSALSNVILATTQWSRVSPEEGADREPGLRNMFLKHLLDNGAVMKRLADDFASAMALITPLIDKKRVVLDI